MLKLSDAAWLEMVVGGGVVAMSFPEEIRVLAPAARAVDRVAAERDADVKLGLELAGQELEGPVVDVLRVRLLGHIADVLPAARRYAAVQSAGPAREEAERVLAGAQALLGDTALARGAAGLRKLAGTAGWLVQAAALAPPPAAGQRAA
ncbi:hypothetical protein RM780_10010 [Streptomyces sp. DSM 44917]|uniref:Uncharacterized protein n=1 Tax=Streptomyces boetiae TaxID=3075541 RepID=A0ABU2L7I8_9ACTN|nr:hypothetical protein [Streptomyces sp. DSM 44917]MDT0307297.1 hypothetical protein [Streptomyces sp. DSM 44917]